MGGFMGVHLASRGGVHLGGTLGGYTTLRAWAISYRSLIETPAPYNLWVVFKGTQKPLPAYHTHMP